MKKALLILAVVSLTFASCSKKKDCTCVTIDSDKKEVEGTSTTTTDVEVDDCSELESSVSVNGQFQGGTSCSED